MSPRRRSAGYALSAALLGAVGLAVLSDGPSCFLAGFSKGATSRSPRHATARQSAAVQMFESLRQEDDEDDEPRIRIEDMQIGQQLSGLITSTTDSAAWVDVGAAKEGLLRASDMAAGVVADVNDVLEAGDMVKVWVKSVEGGKLALSMESLPELHDGAAPDVESVRAMSPTVWCDAEVFKILDYGVLVSVTPPTGGNKVAGLVHQSQMKDGFVDHPSQEVEVGQRVRVRRLEVEGEKLRFSMKEDRGFAFNAKDQDVSKLVDFPADRWIKGVVLHHLGFGAFVQITGPDKKPLVGLLHVNQIRVRSGQSRRDLIDSADELDIQQEIQVRVVKASTETGRIQLSMMPLHPLEAEPPSLFPRPPAP